MRAILRIFVQMKFINITSTVLTHYRDKLPVFVLDCGRKNHKSTLLSFSAQAGTFSIPHTACKFYVLSEFSEGIKAVSL